MTDDARYRLWHQEYACAFWESDRDMAIWRLAREYHERTEAFDLLHCRARNERGIAVPQGEEWSVCNRHAREVKVELVNRCVEQGIDTHLLDTAIRADARRFESDWLAGVRYTVPLRHAESSSPLVDTPVARGTARAKRTSL